MELIHDKENKRFILPLDSGDEARVDYTLNGKHMHLVYSYVPNYLRGQGIGQELVEKTFEKLTEEGYTATAICGYIRTVAAHSEKWRDIIE